VWKDLKKFVNLIDKLNEKSEDIMIVRDLIEKYNKWYLKKKVVNQYQYVNRIYPIITIWIHKL